MKYTFKKKVIAITGAANGIGRAASILLANEGATIIAIDKDKIALKKLKLKLNKNCVLKKLRRSKFLQFLMHGSNSEIMHESNYVNFISLN